ncbi:hypothetical protein [Fusobacterium sp.]|uniref:hypothetical protein n=1 Tax=Fusobacterium sp. TaxID=68766 RepID=UPI0026137EE7|nr:hypothetical protein [Fusobacterium sp.]
MKIEELRLMNFDDLYKIIENEEYLMLEDIEDTIEVYDKYPFLFFFKMKKRYPRYQFRSVIFLRNVMEDPVIIRNVECLDEKAYIIQDEIKKIIRLKEETNIPKEVLREKIIDFLTKYNYTLEN